MEKSDVPPASDIERGCEARVEAEKPQDEDHVPIPYTARDRFLEAWLHPICALPVLPFSIACIVLGVRTFWYPGSATGQRLVRNASLYNKGLPLPDGFKTEIFDKPTTFLFSTAAPSLYVGLAAILWLCLHYLVPRNKLLRAPLPDDVMEIPDEVKLSGSLFSAAAYAYATYYLKNDAQGSGCFIEIDKRRGRTVAKCSMESAACYTHRWPNELSHGAAGACLEAKSMRYVVLLGTVCQTTLLVVYKHQQRLRDLHIPPEQKRKAAKERAEKEQNLEAERQRTGREKILCVKKAHWRTVWLLIRFLLFIWPIIDLFLLR